MKIRLKPARENILSCTRNTSKLSCTVNYFAPLNTSVAQHLLSSDLFELGIIWIQVLVYNCRHDRENLDGMLVTRLMYPCMYAIGFCARRIGEFVFELARAEYFDELLD